jgi:uncharacterized protein with HEPN domain
MSDQDVRFVLARMADCSNSAISFIEGLSKDEFLLDVKTQNAVLMSLVIIGELAGILKRSFAVELSTLPGLPYQQMIGMRNQIAHGYFGLNLETIWATVTQSVPALRDQLLAIGITGTADLDPLPEKP